MQDIRTAEQILRDMLLYEDKLKPEVVDEIVGKGTLVMNLEQTLRYGKRMAEYHVSQAMDAVSQAGRRNGRYTKSIDSRDIYNAYPLTNID